MRALSALSRLKEIVSLSHVDRLANERIILMRDAQIIRLNRCKATRVVLIEHRDDRVLRHVLYRIGRCVRIGDLGVLRQLAEPLVGGGHGLVHVCAAQVEGVPCFVDDDGEHVVLRVEEGDAAVEFEGPAGLGGDVNDMADPLAHLDGDLAELLGHGVDGDGGLLVVAEDPWVAALLVVRLVDVEYVSG